MFILYDLFCFLFCFVYFPHLVLRRKWHAQSWDRFGRRLKEHSRTLATQNNIWVHAVSVGEVLLVKPLLEELQQKYPQYRFLLTTVTKTGFTVARENFGDRVSVLYAPIDFSFVVRRFIRAIAPQAYITAETEIWPNLWSALAQRKIPIIVVNGRVSDKSFLGYRNVRFLLKNIISSVTVFCMQSETDAKRIKELGAGDHQVKVIGNIKFDDFPQMQGEYGNRLGFKESQRIWVAGSTHPGEEEIVLNVYIKLRSQFPDLGLILVPRHPERAQAVLELVERKGLVGCFISKMTNAAQSPDHVVVVDTIGQLKWLYGLADVVFVGKSLTVRGGQNFIEPAFFAKPILVGPHLDNFRDILRLFLEKGALIQVNDQDGLEQNVARLLKQPDEIKRLGRLAKEVVLSNRGATQRTMAEVARILIRS